MLFVSSSQINAQLPFNVDGGATMVLRTPGGVSAQTNCMLLAAKASAASITAGITFQPCTYFTGLPGGGTAVPVQYFFRNDGCTMVDGEYTMTDPAIDALGRLPVGESLSMAFLVLFAVEDVVLHKGGGGKAVAVPNFIHGAAESPAK